MPTDVEALSTVADYQFGAGAGAALFSGEVRIQRTSSGRPQQILADDDSEPFVREGRNAFAKFVREVDPAVRPGDEVLVEHEDGDLIAVGRAELSADAMADFETGMAVKVRNGVLE